MHGATGGAVFESEVGSALSCYRRTTRCYCRTQDAANQISRRMHNDIQAVGRARWVALNIHVESRGKDIQIFSRGGDMLVDLRARIEKSKLTRHAKRAVLIFQLIHVRCRSALRNHPTESGLLVAATCFLALISSASRRNSRPRIPATDQIQAKIARITTFLW